MREGLVVLQNHRMGKKSCWVEMRRVVPQVVSGEDTTMSKACAAWARLLSALRKGADEGQSLENPQTPLGILQPQALLPAQPVPRSLHSCTSKSLPQPLVLQEWSIQHHGVVGSVLWWASLLEFGVYFFLLLLILQHFGIRTLHFWKSR